MVRNTGNSSAKSAQFGNTSQSNGRSPNRKSRKSSTSSSGEPSSHHHHHHHLQQTSIETNDPYLIHTATSSSSIHKHNFYIVSYPIVLLFNILRSILYQLFLAFRYIFTASTRLVYRLPGRHHHKSNNATTDIKLEVVNTLISDPNAVGGDQQQLLLTTSVTSGGETEDIVGIATNGSGGRMAAGPGPGDPLLAKQKHHHRRAFEYISKALKVDENEGECLFVKIPLFCFFFCIAQNYVIAGWASAADVTTFSFIPLR